MLRSKTEPVTIVGYAHMGANRPEGGFTYRDGQAVEEVRYSVDGEDRYRSVKLDRNINGARPDAGAVVHMELVSIVGTVGKLSRDGRPYVAYVEKLAAVGFEVLKPASSARQAA
jgi:hypothetical protein